MLLKITNMCNMNCIHCMEESHINGEHMTDRVFVDSINFMKKLNFTTLLISGGEPTLHPDLITYTKIINKKLNCIKVLISNGFFLNNEKYTNKIKTLYDKIQITNDSRFYPIKIKDPNLKKPFYYFDKISGNIFPLGKGKNIDQKLYRHSPMCFNFRSLFKAYKDFALVLAMMEATYFKFCSFSIDIFGNIYVSECSNCKSIGSIYDSFETINKNIRKFSCNKCGLYNKLDPLSRIHVGEY